MTPLPQPTSRTEDSTVKQAKDPRAGPVALSLRTAAARKSWLARVSSGASFLSLSGFVWTFCFYPVEFNRKRSPDPWRSLRIAFVARGLASRVSLIGQPTPIAQIGEPHFWKSTCPHNARSRHFSMKPSCSILAKVGPKSSTTCCGWLGSTAA